MRVFFVTIFSLLLPLGDLCLALEPTTAKPVVRIGVIIPLTGALAASGVAFREATLMALADIPATSHFSYEAIFEDDKLESKNAATAAHVLISQRKVDALISTWSYGGSVVSPIAQRAGVLHFSIAWAHEVADGRLNYLHLMPPKRFIPALLDVCAARGFKTIGAFAIDEAGAVYALNELARIAPKRGFRLLSKETILAQETDFRGLLLREMRNKPDLLYVNMVATQLDNFITQLRALNFTTPVIVQTGLATVENLVPYEGYWYVSDSYFPKQALEERLVRRTGHRHTSYAANFYDSFQAIVYAYESIGAELKRKPISEELASRAELFKNFSSIFPELEIDADGVFSYSPRYYLIKNGRALPATFEEVVASAW